MVFGDALLEAHEIEVGLANTPRVVLAPSAKECVLKHMEYYASPKASPQNIEVLRDVDGELFVNYLMDFDSGYPEAPGLAPQELQAHKLAVENRLRQFASNPKVASKYSWVGAYHNFFCRRFMGARRRSMSINGGLLTKKWASPSLIVR
ncbi:MAG: hypothetical protein HY720_30135 [Planctomycetes bacterium]|nr:hypothetical protein [Planctomycetota bacterium]